MIDSITNRPIRVGAPDIRQPYIMVSVANLPRLQQVLDGAQVRYEVSADTVSMNGEPPIAFLTLGLGTDSRAVQELLDRN